jgi:hypothetical protein
MELQQISSNDATMPLSADDVGSSAFSSHLDLSRRHDAVSADDDDDDNAGSVSVSLARILLPFSPIS